MVDNIKMVDFPWLCLVYWSVCLVVSRASCFLTQKYSVVLLDVDATSTNTFHETCWSSIFGAS